MTKNPTQHILEKTYALLRQLEGGMLVGLLLLMIALAFTQIILRNFFGTGILWGDALVRILVLWVGLGGAMYASRHGKHISIDLVSRFFSKRTNQIVNCIVELFTALICATVTYFSLKFVLMEFELGSIAFAKVPAWLCESIIPLAFLVMAWRYLTSSILNMFKIGKPAQ